jgi:hypothetical protein
MRSMICQNIKRFNINKKYAKQQCITTNKYINKYMSCAQNCNKFNKIEHKWPTTTNKL